MPPTVQAHKAVELVLAMVSVQPSVRMSACGSDAVLAIELAVKAMIPVVWAMQSVSECAVEVSDC